MEWPEAERRQRGRPVRRRAWLAGAGAAIAGALACRSAAQPRARRVRVWGHQGQEAENAALLRIAAAFHRAAGEQARLGASGQAPRRDGTGLGLAPTLPAELSFFPDFHYTERLSIAAAARDLPDAFELDGPLVARFVDAGLLAPLDAFFAPEELSDFLPTILAQGTIGGRLYALGAFDSAAVLYYDRQHFERARVPTPDPERGWDWREFVGACEKLAAAGIEPLSLHMNETADEWFTYAFSPVIWSGGGRLIAEDGVTIQGVLASERNVASSRAWQGLFQRGFAAADPVDPDPFGSGKVAMDWSGHWMARSHLAAKGAALGVMPLPRLGTHGVAPCGSYCWAISAASPDPEGAAAWVRWVTDAQRGIAPLVAANGAVPARRSAFAAFPEYQHLPYSLFRRQLEEHARPRPRTPFYATLTQHFAAALRDIAHGSEVAGRLAAAEAEVHGVIARRLGGRSEAPVGAPVGGAR